MAAVYAPVFLHSVTRDADFHGLLVGNFQSRHQGSHWACFMALHALQEAAFNARMATELQFLFNYRSPRL